jgi:hypothetical protein
MKQKGETNEGAAISVECPKCFAEFPLSDAVLRSVRTDIVNELQADISRREREVEAKLQAAKEQQVALEKKSAEIDSQVESLAQKRVEQQVQEIREKEFKKAVDSQAVFIKELQKEVEEKTGALKVAQQQELVLRREKRQIEEAKEALALEVQRKLDDERGKLRVQLKAQSDEENRLKIADKEKIISDLRSRLEEAQRKAEQGSQQNQGEVLELDFEQRLRSAFPVDRINEIAKGVRGADVAQEVMSKAGRACGLILYENKRTKKWSDGWLVKLKEDMRKVGAAIGVIVTEAMPNGCDGFGQRDGIWVTDIKSAIALAHVLRCILQEVALAQGYREGAKEKMELLYDYLTGTEFRQRVSAIVDAFKMMRSDLEKERRSLTRAWSKREKQINGVIENMAGMIGDVQGISGNSLQQIPALEFELEEVAEE